MFVRALYTYDGSSTGSLSFNQGDILEVGDTLESGWWDGQLIDGPRGWFPSNYTTKISDEEALWAIEQLEAAKAATQLPPSDLYQKQSSHNVRKSFLDESTTQYELEQELWASLSGVGTSRDSKMDFSSGGDIFAEIAAASTSAASGPSSSELMAGANNDHSRNVPDVSELARMASSHSNRSLSSGSDASRRSGAWAESDFWEPKLDETGQIYYLNSRTGHTSADPPRDQSVPGSTDGPRGSISAESQSSTGTGQSMSTAFYNNLSLTDQGAAVNAASSSLQQYMSRPFTGGGLHSSALSSQVTPLCWADNRDAAAHSSVDGSVPSDPTSRSRSESISESLAGSQSQLGSPATPIPASSQNGRHVPPPIDTSRMSFYSDDSNLDNDVLGKKSSSQRKPPTPRVSAINPQSVRAGKARAGTNASDTQEFPAELEFLDPPAPSLAQLEDGVKQAAESLIRHVRPTEEQSTPEFEYGRAGNLTAHLVSEVKQLLQCTGALDLAVRPSSQSSASSIKTSQSLEESRAALLRPYSKKITSPLNKLVLEARALWGLMSTTDDEEQAIQESFLQEVDTEDDLLLYRENRAQILKMRAESELQLRVDIAIKAQEIVKAVSVFSVFVSDLPPDALGPSAGSSALPAIVKRPVGGFNSSVAALLGPGNGYGASWRGNGFVILPPQSLSSLRQSSSAPVPSFRYQYPSTEFDPKAAAAIDMVSTSVLDQVVSLRGAIAGLISTRNRLSQASLASNESGASNTGALPPTPLQSAQKHISRIATQATLLNGALSKLLLLIDELKIAEKLDLEIDPSSLAALLLYAQTEADSKSKPISTPDDDSVEYNATLLKARQLLASFEQSKQVLYDVGPELLISVQSISMSEIVDTYLGKQAANSSSPSQPGFAAPLEEFRFPQRQVDPLAEILSTLSKLDGAIATVKDALITLLAVTETQSRAPLEARRVSTAARQEVETQRLSQISFNTFDSRTSSGRQTVTATANDSSSQEAVIPNFVTPSGSSSAASSAFFNSPSLNETQQTKASSTDSNSSYRVQSKSYTSSLSSFEKNQDKNAERRRSRVSDSAESTDFRYEDSPAIRSPAQSKADKLKRFFGDDTPPPVKGTQESPKTDKLRKLLGDDAPPASAMARKASVASVEEDMPDFLRLDFEDEMSFGVDGQIKGGTLRALVAKLTAHTSVDHAFISNFLMTYRTFTNSAELFQQLQQRYKASPPDSLTAEQYKLWTERKQKLVRIRTVNVIKLWLESYLMEENPEQLLQNIHTFAMSGLSDTASSAQILRVVEKRRRNGVPKRIGATNSAAAPNPIVPRKLNKIKFLDLDPLEIARQLTIMDSRLCMRITPEECLSKAWPKLFKNECKNITAMISFNNATTHWVQEVILTQEDTRKRANTIKHFIVVAERCHKLQNFAGLIDIVAGLTQTPISRLKRTWDLVQQRHVQSLEALNLLMSPTRHFARYWEQLKRAGPPCVPFLGVFLTSWTFIGDGMADYVRDAPDQINFAKRAKAAELMQQIELHQSTTYSLKAVPALVQYLENCFRSEMTPSALWELSLRIEPRERDDEKIARVSVVLELADAKGRYGLTNNGRQLLSESGFL